MIEPDILLAWGAIIKEYDKHEIIFQEGQEPRYFFQIIEGKTIFFNNDASGEKRLIQHFFTSKQSFGEPLLFLDCKYPFSSQAVEKSKIIKLHKDQFIDLMKERPDLHMELTKILSRRIYDKSIAMKNIFQSSPELRVLGFLDWWKNKKNGIAENIELVPFTRQEIADQTGLCVETVIRTTKVLIDKGILLKLKRKLHY